MQIIFVFLSLQKNVYSMFAMRKKKFSSKEQQNER